MRSLSNKQHNSARDGARRRALDLPAHRQSAAHARAFVRGAAESAGFSRADVADIEVAAGEAITNAILYGHAEEAPDPTMIAIAVGSEDATWFVEVQDSGPGFDPCRICETQNGDREKLNGRGIPLMKALMDRVHFQRGPAGMRVRLERILPDGEA